MYAAAAPPLVPVSSLVSEESDEGVPSLSSGDGASSMEDDVPGTPLIAASHGDDLEVGWEKKRKEGEREDRVEVNGWKRARWEGA